MRAPLNRRDRALVTVAAVAPDLDGLGIIPELLTRHGQHPLFWFTEYHHSLHALWFAILISAISFFLLGRKWLTPAMAFLAFHVHLLEDLAGSRGPDGSWPIPYLFPLTDRWTWIWQGQWKLNAWPNIAITIALLVATIWLAVLRGFSPVEMFSQRADHAVVAALRTRLGFLRRVG